MSHRGRFPIQPPACPPSLQILFPHRPQCGSADPQCRTPSSGSHPWRGPGHAGDTRPSRRRP